MLTDKEFQDILNDPTKRIDGDIIWQNDEDHSPSVEFRTAVLSDAGWPLIVRGSYNPLIPALSYVLIRKSSVVYTGLTWARITTIHSATW